MYKLRAILFLAVLGLVVSSFAGQAVGMQADMAGQGFSYRLLSRSGLGAEIVGRGWYDMGDSTYTVAGELRLLKFFNPHERFSIYVGLGAGAWRFKERYTVWWEDDDEEYQEEERLRTQTGISTVGLVGLDVTLLKLGESSGISVAPEIQFGYYTMPVRVYNMERGESLEYYAPRRFISPGVGIGLRYFW
ncbi:MAG: hypothetical protein U9Q76_04055 [candidate division WOR-3 bacterium]|nr:hypothetical protein [candidate division WOR-3 bacterium]